MKNTRKVIYLDLWNVLVIVIKPEERRKKRVTPVQRQAVRAARQSAYTAEIYSDAFAMFADRQEKHGRAR